MDILNEAAFVTGYLDAAAERGPAPASLYPETAARIRVVVARLVELETADRARRERLRQNASKGGRVGGLKGGAAKSERKRAASRDNLAKGRAVRSARIATGQDPESAI
jgi:hypothetical protein